MKATHTLNCHCGVWGADITIHAVLISETDGDSLVDDATADPDTTVEIRCRQSLPSPPELSAAAETVPVTFQLVLEPKTWEAAEDDCARRAPGGHLATVASALEQEQLASLVGSDATVWIGLNDKGAE